MNERRYGGGDRGLASRIGVRRREHGGIGYRATASKRGNEDCREKN
jgi:hypothetical protein